MILPGTAPLDRFYQLAAGADLRAAHSRNAAIGSDARDAVNFTTEQGIFSRERTAGLLDFGPIRPLRTNEGKRWPYAALLQGFCFFELDIHALARERKLAPFNCGDEVYNDAFLILHRGASAGAAS